MYVVAVVSVVAVCAALAGRPLGAVVVVVGTGVAVTLTELLLAPLVARRLGGDLSYPSGHVTAVAAVAVVVVVLCVGPGRSRHRAVNFMVSVVAITTAAATSVAVVAERTHYGTDAIGGWLVAVASVLLVARVLDVVVLQLRSRHTGPRGRR